MSDFNLVDPRGWEYDLQSVRIREHTITRAPSLVLGRRSWSLCGSTNIMELFRFIQPIWDISNYTVSHGKPLLDILFSSNLTMLQVRTILGGIFRILRGVPYIFLAGDHHHRPMDGQSSHRDKNDINWRISQDDQDKVPYPWSWPAVSTIEFQGY